MFWILSFLFWRSQAQFSPLPPCQAISPSGHFFDWTPLNQTTLTTPNFLANICGLGVWPCESRNCPFCGRGTYQICAGYNLKVPGNEGSWVANNQTNGVATFQRNFRQAIVYIVCDPNQATPKIIGGNGNNQPVLTYISKSVCPIGVCPQGCNYAKGWGSCHPETNFTCTCNIGFSGPSCMKPRISSDLTKVSGPYSAGFIAGGRTWIAFQFFDMDGNVVPCSAILDLSTEPGFPQCEGNGFRNITIEGSKSGVKKFTATLFGEPVKGSPFLYIVSPGLPVWSNSVANGTGLTTAKAGVNSTFSLQLFDSYKNEVKSCPYLIQDHFIGSLFGTSSASVSFTCNGGQLVGVYNVPVAGDYQLLVRYENNVVPGFPTNVRAS